MRETEIAIPIASIESFFFKLDGLALRASLILYFLEFGFKDNDSAIISHEKLASYIGSTRASLATALSPPCRPIDKNGFQITPLIRSKNHEDFGCNSYNIPMGLGILEGSNIGSEESNIFGIRPFLISINQSDQWLHKKTGLSNCALHILILIELMRSKKVTKFFSINDLINEDKGFIDFFPFKIPLIPCRRKKTISHAIGQLISKRSSETNNPLIIVDPNSNTLKFRAFLDSDLGSSNLEVSQKYGSDLLKNERVKEKGETDIGQKSNRVGAIIEQGLGDNRTPPPNNARAEIEQGLGDNRTGFGQKSNRVGAIIEHNIKRVVVVLKTTTRGEVKEIPNSEFTLEFENGDQEKVTVNDVIEFDVGSKIQRGEKPKSASGSWAGFEGAMRTLMRKKGVGFGIGTDQGYDLSTFLENKNKERQKTKTKEILSEIRSALKEGAVLISYGHEKVIIKSLSKQGVLVHYSSFSEKHSQAELVRWYEFYDLLLRKKWNISKFEGDHGRTSLEENKEDGVSFECLDGLLKEGEVRLFSELKSSEMIVYSVEDEVYSCSINGHKKEMHISKIAYELAVNDFKLKKILA